MELTRFQKFKNWFGKENKRYVYCLFCGKELTNSKRKYCSNKCSINYNKKGNINNITPIVKIIQKKALDKIKHNARVTTYKLFPSLTGIKCEECLKNSAKHRHHEDYNKPEEVTFLCRKCHGQYHIKLNTNTREDK